MLDLVNRQLVRDAAKVFADGMVVVFRSFRDLHHCLSTWLNFNLENSELGMLQPIYANKVRHDVFNGSESTPAH